MRLHEVFLNLSQNQDETLLSLREREFLASIWRHSGGERSHLPRAVHHSNEAAVVPKRRMVHKGNPTSLGRANLRWLIQPELS